VISISSAFPILPAQDSLYYELLALTAICGEVPCGCAVRLTSSKSYRKKVVTSLTHDKLLRIFSKDHLRGYRLGIRGKHLLRERAPERFQFYLSGHTDTNSIKSSPARRLRLHRIAQTYVTMLNAGAMIYRDEKPPVFVPDGSSPCRIEAPAFYDSREMKELGLEMVKVHGSRMVGSLLTPSRTLLCSTAWMLFRPLTRKSNIFRFLFMLLLWDFFHQIIYTAMQDTCQAQQGFPLRLVNVFLALLILLDGAHRDFCLSCQFRLAHFGQCAQAL